jgi:DsbC/DsbD-like thiol-disulfide interchange protein
MGVLLALLHLTQTTPGPDAAPIRARHADVVVLAAGAAAFPAGSTASLRLEIRPRPGRSIYAPGQEGYVGFVLTFPPGSGIRRERLVVPEPEPYVFEPTGERLEVFRKPFVIEQRVTFTRDTSTPIAATLRYQACDDAVCYKPDDVAIAWQP